MTRSMPVRLFGVGAALVAALALAGCNTNTVNCGGSSCSVSVSLDPDGSTDPEPFDTRMTVSNITGDSVDVSVGGDRKTLHAGDKATMGGLTITVDSISGNKAEFTVTR